MMNARNDNRNRAPVHCSSKGAKTGVPLLVITAKLISFFFFFLSCSDNLCKGLCIKMDNFKVTVK